MKLWCCVGGGRGEIEWFGFINWVTTSLDTTPSGAEVSKTSVEAESSFQFYPDFEVKVLLIDQLSWWGRLALCRTWSHALVPFINCLLDGKQSNHSFRLQKALSAIGWRLLRLIQTSLSFLAHSFRLIFNKIINLGILRTIALKDEHLDDLSSSERLLSGIQARDQVLQRAYWPPYGDWEADVSSA